VLVFLSVQDLATAFNLVLGNPKASQQIFNISGAKYVTFDGLARACAKVTRFRQGTVLVSC
jgi:nucleoside-diphosphate-sugar epimerase